MLRSPENWTTQALNQLTIKDSQEPTNEESDGEEGSANEGDGPLIKFARFVNGDIELFEARTDEMSMSHSLTSGATGNGARS